jgi:nucleoside-diphosphate-sugar epimerase
VVLRYFNIFGPRQNLDSQYGAVIPLFIAAALHGDPPVIFGDGTQTRDFTFVTNVVDANLLACHAPTDRVAGTVLNIGCGTATSVRELWDQIAAVVGVATEPLYDTARLGDVRHSQASIARARAQLGFQPSVDLDEGLRRTVECCRERLHAPTPALRPPRVTVARRISQMDAGFSQAVLPG